ncbi:hypothetical protein BC629DRAFT_1443770 [Irpex lacteus]|nr:hypothetical protein BC629DRAFT_1443770 [Irpex lacteus]
MPPASRRRSSPGEKPHRPPSNVFKPKFPLDPFAAANVREPWFIRPDALPSPHANPRRDVLLVLGSPQQRTWILSCLETTGKFTARDCHHQPPNSAHALLQSDPKLHDSLELEHAGAVRFVKSSSGRTRRTFMAKVRRLWCRELTEEVMAGVSTATDILAIQGSQSVPPSPGRLRATFPPARLVL